jgi:hypothetical protein
MGTGLSFALVGALVAALLSASAPAAQARDSDFGRIMMGVAGAALLYSAFSDDDCNYRNRYYSQPYYGGYSSYRPSYHGGYSSYRPSYRTNYSYGSHHSNRHRRHHR